MSDTVKKTPPPIEQFEQWLAESEPKKYLTKAQREIAEKLLSLPLRTGKSWLIERLYRFDTRNDGAQIVIHFKGDRR